ncbi:MAG: hypothetical protein O2793_16020, partial [Proteobacteria bacterium]|nr:hypothetical protein [Pseudomonadota bacterium]
TGLENRRGCESSVSSNLTASAKYLKSLCENKGFLFFGIRKNLHLNDQKNKRIFILQVYISNTT